MEVALTALLIALPLSVGATTWVLDPAGNDGAAGTAAAPWKTWRKLGLAFNADTIQPGDTVKFRPGRYTSCVGNWGWEALFQGHGGTAANPITVTVDTSFPGDVEIHGSARSGECGLGAWNQASKCTSGTLVGAACDSSADCGGGTCTAMPGVYWAQAGADGENNGSYWGGETPGVALQPTKSAGGAPKLFEILYSPPYPGSGPIILPTFTAGRDQFFPYPMWIASGNGATNACTAARSPWICCTGAGTGSCPGSRVYVQTASGVRPDLAADATYDQVEVPMAPVLWAQASQSDQHPSYPTFKYVNFTNHTGPGGTDTGRTFFFWWAQRKIFLITNADHLLFEDFDIAYSSHAFANISYNPYYVGTTFPRYAGGDSYLLEFAKEDGRSGSPNVVSNLTFRHGKIHATQGNEMVHCHPGSPPFGWHTFDDVEMFDAPYAVPNGSSGTAGTPNANTNQVNKSWLNLPGYGSLWNARFPTHWGPIGGGTNTDGQMICATVHTTVRNSYFHDGGLISFFEDAAGTGTLFENNIVDLDRMKYADHYTQPNVLLSACSSPSSCGGLEGRLSVSIPNKSPNWRSGGEDGSIIRNNVFYNVYGEAIMIGEFGNDASHLSGFYDFVTPSMIVNNTFWLKGDSLYQNNHTDSPNIYFQYASGTTSVPFIFKNNIFFQENASTAGSTGNATIQWDDTAGASHTAMDYNVWGGNGNIKWKVGNLYYNTLSSFRTAMQGLAGGATETHSIDLNPLFVAPPSNLSIQTSSPAYLTGLNLAATGWSPFHLDIGNHERNPTWSIGAYQLADNTIVTTTSTIPPPSTTSTSTVPVPTTTSTSTTTIPGSATSLFTAFLPVSTGPTPDPGGPVELGLKFGSTVPGNITAIRFYKAAGNTGTHVGNLWDNAGNRLTTVTFANETAGGWQEQTLPVPIHINANTTYLVSYFAPVGGWSYTQNFLATRFTNSPLYALGQNESPNGVYTYGPSSAFPTTNWSGTHYFADVVFAADTNPPTTTVTSLPGTTVTSTTAVTTSTVVTTTTTSTSTTTLPGPFKGSGIGGGSIS